jgi:hypothetical protein
MRAVVKTICLAWLSSLVLAAPVAVAEWRAQLQNGGQVSVDPSSNHATVTRDGVTTQLWDGVHRLQDGSVITVRSGQVVPNEAILDARHQPPAPVTDQAEVWVGQVILGESPCERLVHQVCGTDQQCSQEPSCSPARQLLGMEQQERADSGTPGRMTYSSGQCMEAAKDKQFFRTCQPSHQ